eukprot:7335120-Prymnesium_polylepis.1
MPLLEDEEDSDVVASRRSVASIEEELREKLQHNKNEVRLAKARERAEAADLRRRQRAAIPTARELKRLRTAEAAREEKLR